MANIDKPIFRPEECTHVTDRMIAEVHEVQLQIMQEVHELRLAAVQQSRLSRRVEALEQWHDESVTDGK